MRMLWGVDLHANLSRTEAAERLVINRLFFFVMMTATGIAILMNFSMGLNGESGRIRSSDIVVKAASQIAINHYNFETYELEYEDDEEDGKDRRSA